MNGRELARADAEYLRGYITAEDLRRVYARVGIEKFPYSEQEVQTWGATKAYIDFASTDMAERALEALKARGFSGYTNDRRLVMDSAGVLARSGLKVLAPQAENGDTLVARFDTAQGLWQFLQARELQDKLSLEQVKKFESAKACSHCGKRMARRHLYLAQKRGGHLYTLGTTCGAEVFGVNLSKLWPSRKIRKEARDTLLGLYETFLGDFLVAQEKAEAREWMNQRLPDGFKLDAVHQALGDIVESRGAGASFHLNTLRMLQNDIRKVRKPARYSTQEDAWELTRWGDAVAKFAENQLKRLEKAPAAVAKAERPEVDVGKRATFQATVSRLKVHGGSFGTYQGVTLLTSNGWRLWLSSWDEAFQEGSVVKFDARVSEHKDGLTILSRATRISAENSFG